MKIAIKHTLFTLTFTLFLGFAICGFARDKEELEHEFNTKGITATMTGIAAEINQELPIKINKSTILRRWSYIERNRTMYILYATDKDPAAYTKEEISSYRQFLRQFDADKACKNFLYRIPMEKGVTYNHSYEYTTGEFQMSYTIDINNCQ